MRRALLPAIITLLALSANAHAAGSDPLLQSGFQAMYGLDFASSERHFSDYVRQRPDDPVGYAAQAACVLFTELDRLKALDAEFYLDDKKLIAEVTETPDPQTKRRLFELTGRARTLADGSANGLFALAFSNGLEADYTFLIEKGRLGAARPGRKGFEYAQQLLKADPQFYDAYIWTGVTNYVVASLPFPLRWLAKLRGLPGSKETAIRDLRIAADKGSLLKPYAKILLTVTYLREKRKRDAQALLVELSMEFPMNPLFAKHARRLATP